MRKLLFISFCIVALLFATACSRLEGQKTKINIYVRLPELNATKAATVTAENNETQINNLKIWVFLAEPAGNAPAGKLVGYLEPTTYSFLDGRVNKFEMPIDAKLAREIGRVDMYVLANAVSTDKANLLDINTTRETLDALVLEGTTFGLNADGTPSKATVSADPGIPYSAVGKNLLLEDDYPDALYISTLELVRAVSKVRIVVSQIADANGGKPMDFSITGLQLNGNLVSSKEFVFNDTDKPFRIDASSAYVSAPLTFIPSGTEIDKNAINGCESPSKYEFKPTLAAQDYEDLIKEGLNNSELSTLGFCYLRESDKKLVGQLSYKFNGVQKDPLTFEMLDGEVFSRNSSWIVYIYFFDDSMRISVSGTNWANATVVKIPLT